ncbi:unnamed protein product [Ectocarpus sp. 8 AP-2014]
MHVYLHFSDPLRNTDFRLQLVPTCTFAIAKHIELIGNDSHFRKVCSWRQLSLVGERRWRDVVPPPISWKP